MSCDVGEVTERLENEQDSLSNLSVTSRTSQLILQPFRLYLRHSSFSNPSVASPTSQFILQPVFRFSYAASSSLNSPGEPPMMYNQRQRFWQLEFVNQRLRASRLPMLQHVTDLPLNKENARVYSYPGLTYWNSTQGQLPRTLARPILLSRAHSTTFPSLHLRHNSCSNPSVASLTSQFILQPVFRFSYVTSSSLNSPGEPPMMYFLAELILQPFRHFTYLTTHSPTLPLLHLRHSSFSNPSFASPTSQALHLIHLASRPCLTV